MTTHKGKHPLFFSPPPQKNTIWAKCPLFSPQIWLSIIEFMFKIHTYNNVQNNLNDPTPQIRTISKIVSIFSRNSSPREGCVDHEHLKSWHCQNWFTPPQFSPPSFETLVDLATKARIFDLIKRAKILPRF